MADETPPLVTLRRDDAAMLLTIADLYAPHEHGTGKFTPDVAPVAERVREAVAAKPAGPLVMPQDEFGLVKWLQDALSAAIGPAWGLAAVGRALEAVTPVVEHAARAAAGSHEGIRLWMLDCGELVQEHREHAVEASARLGEQRERAEAAEAKLAAGDALIRQILESLCRRDGLPLGSIAEPGEPARNYELADRLGIGHVFGIGGEEPSPSSGIQSPPAPTFPCRVYGVNLTFIGDEGGIMAEGHVPLRRFVAAANRLTRDECGIRNLMDDHEATLEDVLDGARHSWVLPAAPDPDDEWRVKYGATAETPGAIAVTLWEP